MHYLSDVLAGYALGAFWATTAITTAVVLDRALSPRSSLPEAENNEGTPSVRMASSSLLHGPPCSTATTDCGSSRKTMSAGCSPWEALRTWPTSAAAAVSIPTAWRGGDQRPSFYAVELQPEMQEIHRHNGVPANVEMVLAGADELPLAAGSIDRALSINTFHETHAPEGLRRLAEALRPGGLFVIVDWRRSPGRAEVRTAPQIPLVDRGGAIGPRPLVRRSIRRGGECTLLRQSSPARSRTGRRAVGGP